ncbi:MAG: RnfABCDGE type electron transport complex subunit A [Desulfohalobiaceae bacterium]|nr:RnfABCDGE type electron transport complex subunit A [Desulfohalobiaceae bacterium]
MSDYLLMMVTAIFANNILLIRFLGLCPFVGVSTSQDSALGMSAAALFVNVLASSISWNVYNFLLVPLGLEYLRTVAFILVIASLVQLVEIVLQKTAPALYRALGIYLPLITTNCMIFGVAVLNIQEAHTFIETVVYAFATALGFSLALIILAGIRERFALGRVPAIMSGFPAALVSAGIMGLCFYGFMGLGQ